MSGAMGFGRLIRVGTHRGDPNAIVYVIAEADPIVATSILKAKLNLPESTETEDLGRVTDALLTALNLNHGEYSRT
jgi:hypothetical protein